MHTIDVIEILGALLILAAFAANQLRRLDAHSVAYLVLNVVGAGVLAVIAAVDRSWGFLLLEGTWTVVSVVSLVAALRTRRAGSTR
jgi:heme A synthase